MRKWLAPLLILTLALPACAYQLPQPANVVMGSGRLADKTYPDEGFTRLTVGNGAIVDIARADSYQVLVTADDNVLEYVDANVAGDNLRVQLRTGNYRNITLRVSVRMPALRGLTLWGGAQARITGFRSGDPFRLDASGGSSLYGDLQAGDTTLNLSGGSSVTLRGAGQRLTITCGDGSSASLSDYAVGDARLTANAGCRLVVNAKGRLDVDASAGSTVRYIGSPTLGKITQAGGAVVAPR
jgi:hypothetical protein